VRHSTSDPKDAAIVKAIITLAHSLNLKVIAEGVENQEQLNFLSSLRYDEVQGYLFNKPLPVEAFEELLLQGQNPAFGERP
jgi:EAL domain-containing protein (putative c-di-GMP-specific phosphodiesterase class I)